MMQRRKAISQAGAEAETEPFALSLGLSGRPAAITSSVLVIRSASGAIRMLERNQTAAEAVEKRYGLVLGA